MLSLKCHSGGPKLHSLSIPTRELGEQPLGLSPRLSCASSPSTVTSPRWRFSGLSTAELAFRTHPGSDNSGNSFPKGQINLIGTGPTGLSAEMP